ncbi:FAD-dependent oxidoreductase [Heliobacterium chlorum]|uniref:FAD-dependent oxidoreductase n=1 Tax=Heliobacterium chlorum TaxID=2698 RepID=A0ABR7T9V0_HELCL|nr:FAD-dependent oxidoreductase [Heliobacterium chlorum]
MVSSALLAKAGWKVTVLERNHYPGGCAGTFAYQGYRFDAGATLAGGFYPGGPMHQLGEALDISWDIHPVEPAMVVHLTKEQKVYCWADSLRWQQERRQHFGENAEPFWRWQERTAAGLWSFAECNPNWPPQSWVEVNTLGRKGLKWLGQGGLSQLGLFTAVRQTVGDKIDKIERSKSSSAQADSLDKLRQFIDAQLLIAAQCPAEEALALYGAAALELARRGVGCLRGGIGGMAEALVEMIQRSGGVVEYGSEASQVRSEKGRPIAVETAQGTSIPADLVLLNLPPNDAVSMLDTGLQAAWKPWWIEKALSRREIKVPNDGWGAFMVYIGLDGSVVPDTFPLAHQVLRPESLEGHGLFLTLSPPWDPSRAPSRCRALTMSTHTELEPWWTARRQGKDVYERRKHQYTEQMLDAAEQVIPGLRSAVKVILAGSPVTYQRFTGRSKGWVGGYRQNCLTRLWGPRITDQLWLVGDSIFPGQSTAAVAMGAMRVVEVILQRLS